MTPEQQISDALSMLATSVYENLVSFVDQIIPVMDKYAFVSEYAERCELLGLSAKDVYQAATDANVPPDKAIDALIEIHLRSKDEIDRTKPLVDQLYQKLGTELTPNA